MAKKNTTAAAAADSTQKPKKTDLQILHGMEKERQEAGVTLTDRELLFIRNFSKA